MALWETTTFIMSPPSRVGKGLGVRQMEIIGVLLLTYGSPATLADVPQYLSNVRGGRPIPDGGTAAIWKPSSRGATT